MSEAIAKRTILITSALFMMTVLPARAETPTPYQLDNGLTVILRPLPAAKHVAVVVLFNLGGDHDPVGKSGRAHLLEHLYCTSAAGDAPARDIMKLFSRYPAGSNCQTGFDYTVFAGVVEPDQLDDELKDAAARMGDLRITDADLKREVPRVQQELINMYDRIPSLAGLNHVRLRLHPITGGGRHGGSLKHVRSIGRDELQRLWRDYYKPCNAILVLAGPFEVTKTHELVRQRFGAITSGKASPEKPLKPAATTGTTERIKVKPIMPTATGVVSVGYAAPRPGSKDYAPFLLVVARLWALSQGGFQPGQVQPVYFPVLDDPTTIALQAPLPPGNTPEMAIGEIDQRLQAALVPKIGPLDRIQLINSMLMLGMANVPDTVWARNIYGLAFSVGRRHQVKIDGRQLCQAIKRLSKADMRRVAKNVFAPRKRVVQVIDVQK